MKVLHNPTEAPIKDYPVKDEETGEVMLWNIGPGETLEFPDSVGTYLLGVYGFLQEVITEDQHRERLEEKKKITEGKVFTQVKIVKAEGEVIAPASPQTGFTNENTQPHGEEIAKPPVSDKAPEGAVNPSFVCPDNTCRKEFKSEYNLKLHYGLKHTVMPTA